jgi:hypothetical protein
MRWVTSYGIPEEPIKQNDERSGDRPYKNCRPHQKRESRSERECRFYVVHVKDCRNQRRFCSKVESRYREEAPNTSDEVLKFKGL